MVSCNPLTQSHSEKLESAKLLVVGAGGIGCELLKNLALAGFKNIETVDLDTIDVSNLNRQFLFQKQHVGQSKALIAAEAVKKLVGAENINIIPHKANIFEENYSKTYFQKFDMVLNALDNLKARRHVNRLCISAGIPLIESGSAGYLGQAYPIIKGQTECYDCRPKPRQKTYPACTIRSTPSEPVHCIVWAKYLFNQLFGEEDADQDVAPMAEETDQNEKNQKENEKPAENEEIQPTENKPQMTLNAWAAENSYNPELIFEKLYKTDVETLLSMKDLWKKRAPPSVLERPETNPKLEELGLRETPSLEKLAQLLYKSISALDKQAKMSDEPLRWDKDCKNSLDFVVSAANLRCMVFNIELKSIWDVKSIAGNIIPAIASTNAMVAGLIVLQAVNLLIKGSTKYREATVQNMGSKRIMTGTCEGANEKCYICKDQATATVIVDFQKTTLKEIKEKLLQTDLAMINPDAEISGNVIIDSEDVDEEMLAKTLCSFKDLGVHPGCIIKVEDFSQDFEIELTFIGKSDEHDFEGNYKVADSSDLAKKCDKNEEEDDDMKVGKTAEKRKLDTPDRENSTAATIVKISEDLKEKALTNSPDNKKMKFSE